VRKRNPYFGVTGIMGVMQAHAVVQAFGKAWGGATPTHDLMLGALVSSKTLSGRGNKYPLRYPELSAIRACFIRAPGVINLVHYATGGATGSALCTDMENAMAYGGIACDGIQINAVWPDHGAVRALRQFSPEGRARRIVLQIGPGALEEMLYNPEAIAKRVARDYTRSVTDVLVDVSGGRGIAVDEANRAKLNSLLRDLVIMGDWTVGMAGGLDGEALRHPETRAAWRQHLLAGGSIDAEGRLRDGAKGGGNLDKARVLGYLQAAADLVTGQ
jgi:hypothetical protein